MQNDKVGDLFQVLSQKASVKKVRLKRKDIVNSHDDINSFYPNKVQVSALELKRILINN